MLDHLVYAAPDLEAGVADISQRFGVQPAYGGKHAGGLTHNALLSLGEGVYLEIIGPVKPGDRSEGLPFGLALLASPRLVTWAMRVDDLERAIIDSLAAGYDPGQIIAGARDLPGRGRLEWRLAIRAEAVGDGIVPFLIEWASEPHPATTAPAGCKLVSLSAEHPNADEIRPVVSALGADLPIVVGPAPLLIATIETPNGRVDLS